MIVKLPGFSSMDSSSSITISIRCPSCRQRGTFERTVPYDLQATDGTILGQRRCPNTDCRAHVFFIWQNKALVASYPPEQIDFDATNIPASVLTAIEEAITCHSAGCFTAAAIMVRKTLEELCRERGATGSNLKERIKALSSKVILPPELLNGLDDLRLLGNNAAHIESQEFNQIGKEEVEVGIEFAKEVLKAVYQYSTLLQRLRSLKKTQ